MKRGMVKSELGGKRPQYLLRQTFQKNLKAVIGSDMETCVNVSFAWKIDSLLFFSVSEYLGCRKTETRASVRLRGVVVLSKWKG